MSDEEGDQIGGMSQSELQEKRDKWMEEYGFTKDVINGKIDVLLLLLLILLLQHLYYLGIYYHHYYTDY